MTVCSFKFVWHNPDWQLDFYLEEEKEEVWIKFLLKFSQKLKTEDEIQSPVL